MKNTLELAGIKVLRRIYNSKKWEIYSKKQNDCLVTISDHRWRRNRALLSIENGVIAPTPGYNLYMLNLSMLLFIAFLTYFEVFCDY